MKLFVLVLSVVAPLAFVVPVASADNYRTQSGRVLCAVTPDSTLRSIGDDAVVCQGQFTQPGVQGKSPYTTGDGTVNWAVGNINSFATTTQMAYGQTYRSGNWTFYHDQTGTRFTNVQTGHGMFVSIENVYAF